ncbi:DoxX family protein [Candidatus Pacearchaeota archaeon]|nr:DoxX family protein [Candidatus Pacearchaeota archaeon]
MKGKYNEYGPTLIRVFLGLLLLIPGISKLMNPAGITGLLTGIGFPIPVLFAWIVILGEIIFGVTIIIGWKVKYTAWPLAIILAVAVITVAIPNMNGNPINLLFHLQAIAGLISLTLTGSGMWSIDQLMKKR